MSCHFSGVQMSAFHQTLPSLVQLGLLVSWRLIILADSSVGRVSRLFHLLAVYVNFHPLVLLQGQTLVAIIVVHPAVSGQSGSRIRLLVAVSALVHAGWHTALTRYHFLSVSPSQLTFPVVFLDYA